MKRLQVTCQLTDVVFCLFLLTHQTNINRHVQMPREIIPWKLVHLKMTQVFPSRRANPMAPRSHKDTVWPRVGRVCKSIHACAGRKRLSPLPRRAAQIMCSLLACHTAVVCLMLWKLIRVGDVGIDMARATRTRRAWLSCQRCHRFLTADRTWKVRTDIVFFPFFL